MTLLRLLRRAVILLWLLVSLPARAAPAPLPVDYTHTAWGSLQGAPVDVLKFAQGADGWLWIATATGLYRYDGVRFERTDSVHGHPLYSTNVLGLLAARDGALWVGYRLGGATVLRPACAGSIRKPCCRPTTAHCGHRSPAAACSACGTGAGHGTAAWPGFRPRWR
ncbi:hypothetical protein [Pseudoduganella chitinolytica]|uniref:Uncharacterized protein n=1 Tax=Pseudoduganella chitinolytica TaxID=34070 RepID=A0ABY8BFK6_9BURK|nr:hypothetical protein [Pseudoduganella chitinolytica]WEF34083.1 hypothetical protein PX653_04740 [Pseudoduganella chitinolytica]